MEQISCQTCVGACCRRHMAIRLTPEERDFMGENEAVLGRIDPTSPMASLLLGEDAVNFARSTPEGQDAYFFVMDCPFLQEEDGWVSCRIYDDPERPEACDTFRVGSEACKGAIAAYNESTPVQITPKPKT